MIMGSYWQPVTSNLGRAVVIYNFQAQCEFHLSVNVGDVIDVLQESEFWYLGVRCGVRGVLPKSYVHRSEHHESDLAHEISIVLREWNIHWRSLYISRSPHFETIKTQMYDLINLRSQISRTLPVDEMKRLGRNVYEKIDKANWILGLDLVVRDKHGAPIEPETTSTMQLYHLHKIATDRLLRKDNAISEVNENRPKSAIQQYSNVFLVSVKNFTCKMNDDAQLLITLYDAKEFRSITENYVVRWSRDGLMSDLDQIYNLKVMFTDLGKRDLERVKIFLVCYVVRLGALVEHTKDWETGTQTRRSSSFSQRSARRGGDSLRRPFGVCAMDITYFLNGKRDTDIDQEFLVPFVNCDRDNNLEQTLKKIINASGSSHSGNPNKNLSENKNQALFVSMKVLKGDLKQVREENAHLVLGNVSVARKMGFPEVILPGDVRNDLYITLIKGEFCKGANKASEKNVEILVSVFNENGNILKKVISLGGAGCEPLDEYRSLVYYHDSKPHWYETFKIAVPIEEFKRCHIRFLFKHRSSTESKDKSERPFALSYVRLMQANGTTLRDDRHHLIVYKIDYRRFDPASIDYLKLGSFLGEESANKSITVPSTANIVGNIGLQASVKDCFTICTNLCSTKLTQNVNLLGLLNWACDRENLQTGLKALLKVDGEEVVKFLQDILDVLFNILMDYSDNDTYDLLVFDCLLYIISLVSNDWKYQHFEPVLDLYIRESFSATLAYRKLLKVLKTIIARSNDLSDMDLVFKTMKCLQYIVRFISRSRILYMELYPDIIHDEFHGTVRDLLCDIVVMMSKSSDSILREQGACLKYLPSTIPDLLFVYDAKDLSDMLCDVFHHLPLGRLTKQKMMTINDIVHSPLFLLPECRRILLPLIMQTVKYLLETCEEVELCIKILSDIMDLLYRSDVGSTYDDIMEIIMVVLRTIIQTHINMPRENPHLAHLVAIMLDIFRQMTERHYIQYMSHFKTTFDQLDFLMEILLVFKELVNESVFACDWCDMLMLQNSVILKALRFFSHTIRDNFFDKFEAQAWSNFFHCAIAFTTQPSLQLEQCSKVKREKTFLRYGDMRREMGFEVRSMWFNLGQYKVQFVPSLVGSILEMTLIPEAELRAATIPIFFDMMQCEFYSSKYEVESFGDTKRDSSHVKGNFNDFENEMIAKLDHLVEGGKGDSAFRDLFTSIMKDFCMHHTTMRDDGLKFVQTIGRLMDRLLEYRAIIRMDENHDNLMSCTVNLLDFYAEIGRREMFIRYVNKLYELHLDCDNFTEAAYTLEQHTNLLHWSDESLPPLLRSSRHMEAGTHRKLKEALYHDMIDNFNRGKMWECAIDKCQELAVQYQSETFAYDKLSELYTSMASFYDDIVKKARPEPEYFRVAYYGGGFPHFLRNRVFVYRGKEYERLADFNERILNAFPKAELLNKLTAPGEEITEATGQYVQINKVDPIMDKNKMAQFTGKPILEQIVKYYKVNGIRKFAFSRPFERRDPSLDYCENEFAHMWLERTELTISYSLPGLLRWFPVQQTEVVEISPLEHAIETMHRTNEQLANFVRLYNKDGKNMQINPLSLALNGILDAQVMGGIRNYEQVFLTPEYGELHPGNAEMIEQLKILIANQMPLLELCVQIHKEKAPANLQPLQKRMEDCLNQMLESVVEKYGKGVCDLRLENHVTLRRRPSMSSDTRLSLTSDNSTGRNRVPSLTKGQLRNLTASFNFSASSPLNNSKLNNNGGQSKSAQSSPSKTQSSNSNTPSMSHKRSFKISKDKRRASKSDVSLNSSQLSVATVSSASLTQWYTSDDSMVATTSTTIAPNGSTVVELSQELHPKRPLRSEVEREKRLSRPGSGQFSSSRPNSLSIKSTTNGSSSTSSNRDSIATTDSSISEEGDISGSNLNVPPPLPLKLRELDFQDNHANYSFLYSATHHQNRTSSNSFNNIVNSVLDEEKTAKCTESGDSGNNEEADRGDEVFEVPPIPPPKPPKTRIRHT